MRICIIGLGKMGSALLKGIVQGGISNPADITACDPLLPEQESSAEYYGIRTSKDSAVGAKNADLIILAVKPQVFGSIAPDLAPAVNNKLIVSVMAGISTANLRLHLGSVQNCSLMPNMPVFINAGVSAVTNGPGVSETERQLVRNIFSTLGEVVEVDENLMDGITGLCVAVQPMFM